MDEVDRRSVAGDQQLDDVVEKARDATDEHQPTRPAFHDEQRDDGDDPDQDLPVTRGHVDHLQHVSEGTPVEALDESGHANVDRQPEAVDDQDCVDREQDEHYERGGPQPPSRGGRGLTAEDLFRGLLGLGAHRDGNGLMSDRDQFVRAAQMDAELPINLTHRAQATE